MLSGILFLAQKSHFAPTYLPAKPNEPFVSMIK